MTKLAALMRRLKRAADMSALPLLLLLVALFLGYMASWLIAQVIACTDAIEATQCYAA